MTNAVVWKVPDTQQVWVVADSRVTIPKGQGSSPRVTDQATKIFPLEATVHRKPIHDGSLEPYLSKRLGLCFAGAVVPALMTQAAVSMFLGNLHPERLRLPSMYDIANLIRHLSEKYIRDAAFAYPLGNPPCCEFVVFGNNLTDITTSDDSLGAYWIHPVVSSGQFNQVMEYINLEKGEIAVIGTETQGLRQEIAAIQAQRVAAWAGVEPRIALGRRVYERTHDTVGGTLQFGILERGHFTRFGSVMDENGEFQQNWLGFNYQEDLARVVGMGIEIPSLL